MCLFYNYTHIFSEKPTPQVFFVQMTIKHAVPSAQANEQVLAQPNSKGNVNSEFMEDLRVSSYNALLTPSYVHEEFPMVSFHAFFPIPILCFTII
jgi:hypothetical protein